MPVVVPVAVLIFLAAFIVLGGFFVGFPVVGLSVVEMVVGTVVVLAIHGAL